MTVYKNNNISSGVSYIGFNLIPYTTNTIDIGTSALRIKKIWATDIDISGTATGVTSTMVGLGNVTNNAQVKKTTSVTSGKIPTWNGTTGDALNDGLTVVTTVGATGADTSIPTEQAVREAITASDSSSQMFKYNLQIISVNATLDADKNYMTVGPITIADGVTVTVTTGGNWVIIGG